MPPEPTLVYWCEPNQFYVPLSDGPECPGDECIEGKPSHRMRKRRGYLCTHETEWAEGPEHIHLKLTLWKECNRAPTNS